ncbi:hypothetical protein [uncultured Polaribacter sp.]|uniref:hypothetical protein n=1 Tax=uncultured Polaribacter sp. TaxID=174711 RepID=UPI002628750E|nr:hypothetical protein [uncultured Polaribacter sp.]
MKKIFIVFLFLSLSSTIYSQKTATKKFQSAFKEVSISTMGLDNFILENSGTEFIEIILRAENPNKQHIVVKEVNGETVIKFNIPTFKREEKIFRKYITKRLKRAAAILKIPKNTNVSIFGEEIHISSKSYHGNLRIFIENGIVKLDTIQQNLELKLYTGNVFATLKKTHVDVISNSGKIKIDGMLYHKKYQKTAISTPREVSIITKKGNIFLTHR